MCVSKISSEYQQLDSLTMSKRHDAVHRVKDHRMVKHTEVVQLAKIFDLCNSSLVELEIILFQA